MALIFRWSRSMPVVWKPALASSTASGRPTYPRPTTPVRARRVSIFSSSDAASADISILLDKAASCLPMARSTAVATRLSQAQNPGRDVVKRIGRRTAETGMSGRGHAHRGRGGGTLHPQQTVFLREDPPLFRQLALPLSQRGLALLHFGRPPRRLFHCGPAGGFRLSKLLFVGRRSARRRRCRGRSCLRRLRPSLPVPAPRQAPDGTSGDGRTPVVSSSASTSRISGRSTCRRSSA